jgi:hypothetical protein
VHGWIFSAAVSQIGDMAWYIGLAFGALMVWSVARLRRPETLSAVPSG